MTTQVTPNVPNILKSMVMVAAIVLLGFVSLTEWQWFGQQTDQSLGLILLTIGSMLFAPTAASRWLLAVSIMFLFSSIFVPQGLYNYAITGAVAFWVIGLGFILAELRKT